MQVCGGEGLGNLQLLQVVILCVLLSGMVLCIRNPLVDAEREWKGKNSDGLFSGIWDVLGCVILSTFNWIQKL